MKAILIVISVFYVFFSYAQDEKKVPEKPERFLSIKMAKMPIADFPEESIPVSGIRVIQVLGDSLRMGFAIKGMIGNVVTLKFENPLTEVLQEQIKRMYKHEYKKSGAEIFLVVRDLRLGEKGLLMERSYTHFDADAYLSKSKGLFTKVCTIDTVLVFENSPGHGSNIENAFRVLVRRTLAIGSQIQEQAFGELTIDQITEQARQQKNIPILTDSVYMDGAYANFEEFLQNRPSVMEYELVTGAKKEITIIKTDQNAAKKTIRIWGLCKGGEIYKYYEQTLIPIERESTRFIISDYVIKTSRKNNNFFYNAMIGGAVGGLAGGMYTLAANANNVNGKPLLVKSIPYISIPEKQPEATCIDMKTGEFSF